MTKLILDISTLEERTVQGKPERHAHHVDCIELDGHEARLLMAALADKREVVAPYDYRSIDKVLDVLKQAAVRS